MTRSVLLRGYRYSVYHRIVRLVLHEKGIPYAVEDINPFASDISVDYLRLNPFGNVPALSHGDFTLYETVAITRYLDLVFDGPGLSPECPKALAQMTQVISIIDNYAYLPMVRQVFANRVFNEAIDEPVDEAEIAAGIRDSHIVLGALSDIANSNRVLCHDSVTIADLHLAPMMAYFAQAPEGMSALNNYPILVKWWKFLISRESLIATDPGLPSKEESLT